MILVRTATGMAMLPMVNATATIRDMLRNRRLVRELFQPSVWIWGWHHGCRL
jgi:hypothetical protein